MTLTVKRIAKATQRGRYFDGHGLYLQVMSAENRSWLFRYEINGRKRWMGLGSLATFNLDEARERARAARQLLADGHDPLEARRAERAQKAVEAAKNVTFTDCAQQYFDAHAASWGNRKHREQFMRSLRQHASLLLGLPVNAVDEPMVLAVLRPIWAAKTVTAKRVRNRIAAVLDYASAAGYRKGSNPARWEGHLEHLLAAPDKIAQVKHMAALPYSEVAAFLAELRKQEGIPARALEFLVLTTARTGEVVGARWDEIDLNAKVWTVPAVRMKTRKAHRVPLSDKAVELLAALPREGDFVFVGTRPGAHIGELAMARMLRRLRSDATVHGFRSSFRDWAAEATSFPHEVCELAHKVGNAVERAYKRSDLFAKRAKLMEAWAQYCDRPATSGGEVVALRKIAQ